MSEKNDKNGPSIEDKLKAMQEAYDAFERSIDSAPQESKCAIHKCSTRLDRNASIAMNSLVYICQRCVDDEVSYAEMKKIIAAGIPPDVRHARLENFRTNRTGVRAYPGFSSPSEFMESAMKWVNGDIRNLILTGTPGIGKGHLAAACAIHRINEGAWVEWVESPALFREYHEAYKTDETEEVIRVFSDCDVLVLDEICFRPLPKDGEVILFDILSSRYKHKSQTILVGNKAMMETKEWLGDRVSDRLMAGGMEFRFGSWDSMRGESGGEWA